MKPGYYIDRFDDFLIVYPDGTFDVSLGILWHLKQRDVYSWFFTHGAEYVGPL